VPHERRRVRGRVRGCVRVEGDGVDGASVVLGVRSLKREKGEANVRRLETN